MKLHILSDLHAEFDCNLPSSTLSQNFFWEQISETDSDVIILVGDTHTDGRSIPFAAQLFPGRPVVMVAGNHEFYNQNYQHHLKKLRKQAEEYPCVHFLECAEVEIGDVIFLGCTLWTDCQLFPDQDPGEVARQVEWCLNDFHLIGWVVDDQNHYRKIRVADTVEIHRQSLAWLENRLEAHRGRKIVVVTHHAPSEQSIHPNYAWDVTSSAFASNLDDLVERSGAALWVHGHVHTHFDYMIGKTRVLANPKGYPHETETRFRPNFVVEV